MNLLRQHQLCQTRGDLCILDHSVDTWAYTLLLSASGVVLTPCCWTPHFLQDCTSGEVVLRKSHAATMIPSTSSVVAAGQVGNRRCVSRQFRCSGRCSHSLCAMALPLVACSSTPITRNRVWCFMRWLLRSACFCTSLVNQQAILVKVDCVRCRWCAVLPAAYFSCNTFYSSSGAK